MAENINAAVGTSPAPNNFEDVETIQSLLNQVPDGEGGPSPLLDVDGICGPLTIAAIRRFQQRQLNFNDGRVDVNQQTFAKLITFDNDPNDGNPIKFEEFRPFDGFQRADPFRNSPPWQMVPLGGSKIVRIQNGQDIRSVTCNNTGIARALLLGPNAVQIFGVSHGTTLLKVRNASGRVLARLDVSVKRRKTVRTSFFFVKDNSGNETTRPLGDADTAIAGMNDIWLPQANVEFVKKNVTKPLTFARNFGTEVRFTAHLAGVAAAEHEWDIVVARRDPGADFNVFFVTEYEDDTNLATDNADAGTIAHQKSCLCDDNLTGHTLGLVLAHEAGHNMSLDHETIAPANLMGTAPTDTDRKLTRKQIDRVNP